MKEPDRTGRQSGANCEELDYFSCCWWWNRLVTPVSGDEARMWAKEFKGLCASGTQSIDLWVSDTWLQGSFEEVSTSPVLSKSILVEPDREGGRGPCTWCFLGNWHTELKYSSPLGLTDVMILYFFSQSMPPHIQRFPQNLSHAYVSVCMYMCMHVCVYACVFTCTRLCVLLLLWLGVCCQPRRQWLELLWTLAFIVSLSFTCCPAFLA